MSWYVERLLKDSYAIKNNYIRDTPTFSSATIELNDDDDYDNLLSVEVAISKLHFTKKDKILINFIKENLEIRIMSEVLHWSRPKVVSRIKEVTDQIATLLGDQFTDVGYVKYIGDKHNYDDYQRISLLTFLEGNYG